MTIHDRRDEDGSAGPAESNLQADGGLETANDVTIRTRSAESTVTRAGWKQIGIVAGQEYQLSVRNRWAFALTGLFALLSVLLTVFGGSNLGPARVDAIVVSLAQLATYLVPLAALVYGFDTIVGAEEDGWLDVVFALPVARSAVVFGKYLGRAITLTAATLVGFGLAGAVLVAGAGLAHWSLYVTFLLGAVGVGLAFLSVAVLVSTLSTEKTHALGAVLLVWVWFVFIHDLVALGAVAALELPDVVLSAFVLTNPADVFRVLVLQHANTTGGGLSAVFAGTRLTVPVLVAALLAWCLLPVLVASRAIRRRSI
jgi:Cu-processing system permease protein